MDPTHSEWLNGTESKEIVIASADIKKIEIIEVNKSETGMVILFSAVAVAGFIYLIYYVGHNLISFN